MLLTDGTVMVQAVESGNWYRLAPDLSGNYLNGTWTGAASLQSGYTPYAYASAVLPDGRMIIEGGERDSTNAMVQTNQGAIFDPTKNTWTPVSPPAGWTNIGDASSVVLPNGTFMMTGCCSPGNDEMALLDAQNLTWTVINAPKPDADLQEDSGDLTNDEEGWVLLPSGKILTVELFMYPGGPPPGSKSDLFDPTTNTWSSAAPLPASIGNPCGAGDQFSAEMGPMVLRPDGTVLAVGGNAATAVYDTNSGTWSEGPSNGANGSADGPGVVLPDGNVFFMVSYGLGVGGPNGGCYEPPSYFLEYSGGSQFIEDPPPPNAQNDASLAGEMLLLPTGQVLFTDETSDIEIFTPSGTYQPAWQPTVSSWPDPIYAGSTNNAISGTQFNGLSQGAMYGDDAQMATNFPLVRITNGATGHVFYCRTHGFSTMGVATGATPVSAEFDCPLSIESGESSLEVVANGIPSDPVYTTVLSPGCGAGGGTGTPGQGSATIWQGPGPEDGTFPAGPYGGSFTEPNDGTLSVTVGCVTETASYWDGESTGQIASDLAAAFNSDPASPVAAATDGSTVQFTAKLDGTDTDYSISTSSTWNTQYFSAPAFSAALSGSTLTGGSN